MRDPNGCVEGAIDGERLQRLLHPASFGIASAMAVNEGLYDLTREQSRRVSRL
jgi:hypothetical protein